MRSHYCEKVQNLYGKIQLLNRKRKQVDVDSLYVDVYFLEKLSSESFANIPKLLEGLDSRDNFDRLGLGKRQKRSSGLEAVEKSSRLVILGKPGSGKSTFLRHLAVACCNQELFPDFIPILIELRCIGDVRQFDLLAHIHQEFKLADIEQTKKILDRGKILILLDGLDEVPARSQKTGQNRLFDFSKQYYKNHFILTCRTQTTEYILPNFDYVEVADFNPKQVAVFVQNWFTALAETPQGGKVLIDQFIAKLRQPENKQTAELAVTPILLSLTCWIFTELQNLPSKRSDLYKQGLNLLLSKWDTSRGINRDSKSEIYCKLSTEDKFKLLSYLAAEKFKQKQSILFEQSEIQKYLAKYLNISDEESEIVLKAIEEQHGLLIERTQGIWSFSHLTFHEYLAARWFVDNSQLQNLVNLITNKSCREVFLLVIEIVNHAEKLLQQMKIKIDTLLASDKKLQEFLDWNTQKSSLVDIDYKPASIRAFYLKTNHCSGLNLGSDLAFDIDAKFKNDSSGGNLEGETADIHIQFPCPHHSELYVDEQLDAIISKCLDSYPNLTTKASLAGIDSNDSEFNKALKEVISQLPTRDKWDKDGILWVEQLQSLSIKYRMIGKNWQFSENQKELLTQYYYANKLLVDCLNSGCSVNDEVRKEIEETLILPLAEIEKRKQSNT